MCVKCLFHVIQTIRVVVSLGQVYDAISGVPQIKTESMQIMLVQQLLKVFQGASVIYIFKASFL